MNLKDINILKSIILKETLNSLFLNCKKFKMDSQHLIKAKVKPARLKEFL